MNTQDKQEKNIRALLIVWIVLSVVQSLLGGAYLLFDYYVVPQVTLPLRFHGQSLLFYSALNVFVFVYLLLQFNKLVARLKSTAK